MVNRAVLSDGELVGGVAVESGGGAGDLATAVVPGLVRWPVLVGSLVLVAVWAGLGGGGMLE